MKEETANREGSHDAIIRFKERPMNHVPFGKGWMWAINIITLIVLVLYTLEFKVRRNSDAPPVSIDVPTRANPAKLTLTTDKYVVVKVVGYHPKFGIEAINGVKPFYRMYTNGPNSNPTVYPNKDNTEHRGVKEFTFDLVEGQGIKSATLFYWEE